MGKFDGPEKATTRLIKRLINQRRKELGISNAKLSKLLGKPVKKIEDIQTLRDYGCNISVDDLPLFAKILGVDVEYFFDQDNLN